jgi:sugar lactone lactonase YvrE
MTSAPLTFAVMLVGSLHCGAINPSRAQDSLQLALPKERLDRATTVAFSPDGHYALVGDARGNARLWDLVAGILVRRAEGGHSKPVGSAAIARGGRIFLTGGADGAVRLWKTDTGELLFGMRHPSAQVTAVAFGRSELELIIALDDKSIRIWDAAAEKEILRIKGHRDAVNDLDVSNDGTKILSGGSDATGRLWDAKNGEELTRLEGHDGSVLSVAIDQKGHRFITAGMDKTVRTWDMDSGKEVGRFQIAAPGSLVCAAFSADRTFCITSTTNGTAELWDLKRGQVLQSLEGNSRNLLRVSFAPDGASVLGCAEDGTAQFWDVKKGRKLCSLIALDDGVWAVTDPDGRFFTDDPDRLHGLSWVAPDAPSKRLPVELLIRDYFQPRLLPMSLDGEQFARIQPLGRLNHASPLVKISRVQRLGEGDAWEVTVEVSAGISTAKRAGKDVVMTTAPYDLRLFREGQLVGQWPAPNDRDIRKVGPEIDDDRAWRARHLIEGVPGGRKTSRTFTIKLPHRKEPKTLEISAYAFNEDRVKSLTDRYIYQIPEDIAVAKRRAYLITMGVNAFEDPAWDLQFAASDARRVQQALGSRLQELRKFEVVQIWLISDRGVRRPGEAPATRENLQAVLSALSGSGRPAEGLGRLIAGGEKLRPATPDDLVFIFTSTHGYTKPGSGDYYLFPHDIGLPPPGSGTRQISDELLARCVSSGELSSWLRPIDAGQLALVVDACHAAATVEQPGFKPGPMGSRGLGQLAYDKGMRVLAASAADDVAIEAKTVKHGLLTYALVREGLEQRRARPRRIALEGTKLTLVDWFSYAERRVPGLYEEVCKGSVRDADDAPLPGVAVILKSKGGILVPLGDGGKPPLHSTLRTPTAFQHPVLFDFSKGSQDVILDQTEVADNGRRSVRSRSPAFFVAEHVAGD